uniref:translation initiation factor IF-2-like n=1 Tax=Agelaius phoeniceus TaxID=39638 RepID=UPI0023EAFC94|nr:translation initiation factor IF-2-like [Agelaius phoeniceus]
MPAALFSAAEPARCAPRPRSPRAPPLRALPEGQRCFQPGKRRAKRLWEREKGGDKKPRTNQSPFAGVCPVGSALAARGGGQEVPGGPSGARALRERCAGRGNGERIVSASSLTQRRRDSRKALGSGFDSLETLSRPSPAICGLCVPGSGREPGGVRGRPVASAVPRPLPGASEIGASRSDSGSGEGCPAPPRRGQVTEPTGGGGHGAPGAPEMPSAVTGMPPPPRRRAEEAACALSVGPAAAPGSRFRLPAGSPDLSPAPEVPRERRFPRTWQRHRLRGRLSGCARPAPVLRDLVLPRPPPARCPQGERGPSRCPRPVGCPAPSVAAAGEPGSAPACRGFSRSPFTCGTASP